MDNNVRRKKNTGLKTIIIILLLVIIGLGGYIVFDKLVKGNDNEQLNPSEQQGEQIEVELTDETIKADVSKKIEYLTNESSEGWTTEYTFRNGTISDFGNVFSNLDDDLKLYIVLDYLLNENKFHNLSPENESDPIVSSYAQTFGNEYVKQITGKEVKDAYNSFFGTSNVDFKVLKSRNCFNYDYESTKDIFYRKQPNCGGTSGTYIYSYKNKYSKKNDNVYVYVSYGSSGIPENNQTATIFKDLEKNNVYREFVKLGEVQSFRINESNYADFSEYKYTFKKNNDGSYYFVSFEKTK